jgi:hypothetical protein
MDEFTGVAGLVARAEHEVVDEQLRAPVEQLEERLVAIVRVEAVLLLHRYTRQLASLPRDLVAEPGVLLLTGEQLLACGEPLFAGSDPVSHRVSLSSVGCGCGRRLESVVLVRGAGAPK